MTDEDLDILLTARLAPDRAWRAMPCLIPHRGLAGDPSVPFAEARVAELVGYLALPDHVAAPPPPMPGRRFQREKLWMAPALSVVSAAPPDEPVDRRILEVVRGFYLPGTRIIAGAPYSRSARPVLLFDERDHDRLRSEPEFFRPPIRFGSIRVPVEW